jgi:glycosyltransferase involved in cell wall biosynthesis
VVTNLAQQHRKFGVVSEAVVIAPANELMTDLSSWPGVDRVWPILLKKRWDFSSMWKVFRIIRQRKPEIVICHTHRHILSIWLGQLCGGRKPRIVLAEHHAISLRSKSDDLWSFIGILLTKAIVVSTSFYANQYRWKKVAKLLKRSLLVIPNGVSLPLLDEQSQDHDKRTVVLGMAARLVGSKDISTILTAMDLLRKPDATPQYKFLIAGDGPMRAPLERERSQLRLDDDVIFLGMLNQVELDKFYRSIDIYIHSTQAECFGMVVLEAASYALPIIATRVEGVVTEIPNDCIQLFTLGDAQDLADKIHNFDDKKFAEEMGNKAHKHVVTTYGSEEVALAYLKEINSICKSRSR